MTIIHRSFHAAGLLLLTTLCSADDLEASSRYSSRLAEFEQSRDLSWAYRLAWIASSAERPDLVANWLRTLSDGGWRMGIDPSAINVDALGPSARDSFAALQNRLSQRDRVSETIVTLADPELIPESIGYDPINRTLYAGSLHRNNVVTVASAGRIDSFSTEPMGAVYGIKYDGRSSSLWALHNPRIGEALYGELVQLNRSGGAARRLSPPNNLPRELNDLCFDDDIVYVTDSLNGRLLFAPRSAELLQEFGDDITVPYANGVACDPNEPFVFVAGATGIYRFDKSAPRQTEPLETPSGISLGGIDGLYWHAGTLVGVQNALGAPKIVIASLDDGEISQVRFHDVLQPDFRVPTTGFVFADCFYYIANSSLDALDSSGTLSLQADPPEPARVRALPLLNSRQACRL